MGVNQEGVGPGRTASRIPTREDCGVMPTRLLRITPSFRKNSFTPLEISVSTTKELKKLAFPIRYYHGSCFFRMWTPSSPRRTHCLSRASYGGASTTSLSLLLC